MKDGTDLPVDLIIDCTGFRRAIIGQLNAGWTSYSDFSPLNKAMPFWLEHAPEVEIAPYTKAQAMGAGWMWSIPTQDRIGCGYVFSDAHMTPETAQSEVEAALRHSIEPRGVLSIDPGRLNNAWSHNCIAIGLAQSFLEPLEATSIHGSLVQALLLTKIGVDKILSDNNHHRRISYNATVARQVDDFAQFINLHYAGGRDDTSFWKDMASQGLTDINNARLLHWQAHPVLAHDFTDFPHNLPHVEEQLYTPVLSGLGLVPPESTKMIFAASGNHRKSARLTLQRLKAEYRAASKAAIGHRRYLEILNQG
jgi:hypothetical protein